MMKNFWRDRKKYHTWIEVLMYVIEVILHKI